MSDWGRPLWIAHRGGGRAAPENTLAAIRAGAAAGFRMVEFDVMLSRDGVPVLIHDDTLERTTGGRGAVAEHDFAALRQLDAGAWLGPAFAGEVIPTLEEAIALLIELGLDANIEIKPAPGHARATGDTVARTVAARWPVGRTLPLFSSFDFDALDAARARAPEVPRGLLFEAVPDDWRTQMRALGAVSLHCDHDRLEAERLADIVGAGIPLLCYTVNQADRATALIAAGVRGLFTDCLDLPGQVAGH